MKNMLLINKKCNYPPDSEQYYAKTYNKIIN
jgi:hypothetical protein